MASHITSDTGGSMRYPWQEPDRIVYLGQGIYWRVSADMWRTINAKKHRKGRAHG